ncbi:hypothetical protein CXB40_26270 [Pseudomonas syringae pv. avii]|nr:hypothetical protein [Pseudomonas syringae]MCF5241063.1 hypothetical protein [Pseudomonas syringae]POP98863.1 hypothetical protein CXB40_26270 [Pseudomonas syringae pv. avii]
MYSCRVPQTDFRAMPRIKAAWRDGVIVRERAIDVSTCSQ